MAKSKVIKRSNLVVPLREYEVNGETKKVWRSIGELTLFSGDNGDNYAKAELYHMPGVSISVFDQKEKDTTEF